ncbi:MAG: dihydrolipoyl dehydrogenase [Thaumarchaeota archaeon]|nr:dihydrolipoyl dehydrogenase [Nitrososphaerota archaeon]
MKESDLVVVGGGIGGYVCAIRASQLGKKVILVEKARLGGECLIAGCIPSKAIISVAKAFDKVHDGARFGIHADGLRVDFSEMQSWKSGVVSSLEAGVASLCQGYKVQVLKGEAELVEKNRVIVTTPDGSKEELSAKNVVIATGSSTIQLPGLEFDGRQIVGSREALDLKALPKRLLVVGGGYIGMEIASMYQRLGSQISIVELTEQLLPGTEPDLVRFAQRSLERRGAKIRLGAKVTSISKDADGVKATVESGQGTEVVQADLLLVSVGRRPVTQGLNLQRLGIETDPKGFIKTDNRMMTTVDGVFAIGDVRGPPLLAHKAQKEGIVAAEAIAGLPTVAEWKSIPWAIFTDPEISGVGLTEKQAVEAGYKAKRSRISFAALGRALAAGETDGFVRIVSEEGTGVVLGVQIVGPEASDLISEAALAIEMGATVEDLALTIHPHPTLPEAIMEAAESASGKPIHQLKSI